ncbi:MAG TPA: hypothetical protein VIL11_01610 [Limnochordales bacterium]
MRVAAKAARAGRLAAVVAAVALAAAGMVAGAAALPGVRATAQAQSRTWTWHGSVGMGLGGSRAAAVLTAWAGVPSLPPLFLRAGAALGARQADQATVELGLAYFFSPGQVLPWLAQRLPGLDPFGAVAIMLGPDANALYGAVGGTYAMGERSWFWGELRVGSPPTVVLGLGLSF